MPTINNTLPHIETMNFGKLLERVDNIFIIQLTYIF